MLKQNLHTHSIYCDGKDTLEEMVLMAIDKHFTVLGFSGHAYGNVDDVGMSKENQDKYKEEILSLKEKYKDKITIYLGIEQDLTYVLEDPENYDYIIGSKHYMNKDKEYLGVDYSKEVTKTIVKDWYDGNFNLYAKDYYEGLKVLKEYPEYKIVGHLDLIMKYNEDESFIKFDDEEYLQDAYACIDTLVEADKIFEINTGAIARGLRKSPYPEKHLLQYIHKKGGKILINSDCHNKEYLDCGYEECIQLAKDCGFTKLMYLTKTGFVEKDITEFE